jgi:hypothetical protein|nr:MAG TPA: hypothetical protein [Caudoviricetes sp.]
MKLDKAFIASQQFQFKKWQDKNVSMKYLIEKSLKRFKDNTANIDDLLDVYSFFKEIWDQPMIHIEVAEELEELVEVIQPKMKNILDEWLKDVKRQIKDIKEQE